MWLWALLPLSLAVFGTAGIWIVYAISVSNGTVNITERFPYISECGSYPPQSTFFSQYCNICAFLGLWIVALRFQQVRDYADHGKANTLSAVLGFLSCVGVSVLGNFQQSVQRVVHLVGAFTAFFLGVGYFWVQLFLMYQAKPSHDRHWVGPCRALCCALRTILVITMVVLARTGHRSAAALCEWALVMLFFCLFGLFGAEFRHMDCHQLKVQRHVLQSHCSPVSVVSNHHLTPVHVR
ncbi:unnamed protein product [Knipowitschia caucasica]|uniref:CWH43-like N-terminal domain-containing protein n=1 Tax=Knipowitschia caucasica TaxID=637954 RepID=A0AAV2KFV0_KNICA